MAAKDHQPSPAGEKPERAIAGPKEPPATSLSPEVRRIVDATRALPYEDQEYILVGIIASLEEEGGIPDQEIERLWSGLVRLKLRRRAASRVECELAGSREAPRGEGESQKKTGRPSEADDFRHTIRRSAYPFLVEGLVDGLPFCLLEEGKTWRFVVSRDPAVDPRAVRSNREGFVVSGCVASTRVRGEDPPMTDEQILDLIDISREILRQRVRAGRARDAPGLTRTADGKGLNG